MTKEADHTRLAYSSIDGYYVSIENTQIYCFVF